MKAKRTCGVSGLVCCVVACAVGAACSAGEARPKGAFGDVQAPSFTKMVGIGEGAFSVTPEWDGDVLRLVVWDANGPCDSFGLKMADDKRLVPTNTDRRMTFWLVDDGVGEIVDFIKRGLYRNPIPLTTKTVEELDGHYRYVAAIEYGGKVTLALGLQDGMAVYANVDPGVPAFFSFATEVFDGLDGMLVRYAGEGLRLQCCINCGGTGQCCCTKGDSCKKTEHDAKCYKGKKLVEKCWCEGSDCSCEALTVCWNGNTMDDQSSDGPGMGNQEE